YEGTRGSEQTPCFPSISRVFGALERTRLRVFRDRPDRPLRHLSGQPPYLTPHGTRRTDARRIRRRGPPPPPRPTRRPGRVPAPPPPSPPPTDTVVVHQTHISAVSLAGPFAYKLKKPVRLGFLDFSTPELRRHFCEKEVRLNRRLAPRVYLDVEPVTEEEGRL